MILRMERTGGFSGIPLRAEIDSERLSPDESRALKALVEDAGFFNLPAVLAPPPGGADRFHYHLTVEEAGRRHSVEVGEAAVPEPLQALIRQVTVLARRSPRG